MYQAKSGVKNLSLYWGGSPPPRESCSEWAETNFGFGIFWDPMISQEEGGGVSVRYKQPDNRTDTRHSDQISRSAWETARLKRVFIFSVGAYTEDSAWRGVKVI